MRHRGLETLAQGAIDEAISRCPADDYVIWTGHPCGVQRGSMRSRAFSCITELGEPVPLRVVMRRAAQFEVGAGFDPGAVREAVRVHQKAQPVAYLLVRKLNNGDYVAAMDMIYPAAVGRPVRKGEPLIAAGVRRFEVLRGALAEAGAVPSRLSEIRASA